MTTATRVRLIALILVLLFNITFLQTLDATGFTGIHSYSSRINKDQKIFNTTASGVLSNSNLILLLNDMGQFTLATSGYRYLLYPSPETSYLSVKVGNNVYRNSNAAIVNSKKISVIQPLSVVNSSNAFIVYRTPENIEITLKYRLETSTVAFVVEIVNRSAYAHDVDIRFFFDTQVDTNDGSPLYAPGLNIATYETELSPPVSQTWRGFDRMPNPSLSSEGKLSNMPYRMVFGWWPTVKDHAWDYAINPAQRFYTPGVINSPASDSAVLLYFDGGRIASGGRQQLVTYYGLGSPDIIGSRDKLIAKYGELRDALKHSIQSDLYAYADIQARYLVSSRLQADDVLQDIWNILSLGFPSPSVLARFGKGSEKVLDTAIRIALMTSLTQDIAIFMRDIVSQIPMDATLEQARDNYIYPLLLYGITLDNGERIGVKSYIERIDKIYDKTVQNIPVTSVNDYSLLIQMIDLQINAINESTQRETWVPVYTSNSCTMAQFGVLQEQRRLMVDAAKAYKSASDWEWNFTVAEMAAWGGAAVLKVAGIIGMPLTLGSSSVVLIPSESVLWGGAASISLVPSLLGTGATSIVISRGVGMAQLATQSLTQLANDLKARERFFVEVSEHITGSTDVSRVFLATNQAFDQIALSSFVMPDITVSSDQTIGRGEATLSVQNNSGSPVTVAAYGNLQAQLGNTIQTIGLVSAPQTVLPPYSQTTIRVPISVPRSSVTSGKGYFLQMRLALSNSSGSVALVGPYLAHFYVGTTAQLVVLGRQTFSTVFHGSLMQDTVSSHTINFANDIRQSLFVLFSSVGSDYDIHLYDALGRHVGINYATGVLENQIPGVVHSGAWSDVEWIELNNIVAGNYEIRVVSLLEQGDFALTRLDRPHIPAILDISQPIQWSLMPGISTLESIHDTFNVRLSESGGFDQVKNIKLTFSDLVNSKGFAIPAHTFSCQLPTIIQPGQNINVRCDYEIPELLPYGTYSGYIEVAGVNGSEANIIAHGSIMFTFGPIEKAVYFPLVLRP